jgi:hypothetical protein
MNTFSTESSIFQFYLEGVNIVQCCSNSNVNGSYTVTWRLAIQVLEHTEMYQKHITQQKVVVIVPEHKQIFSSHTF